jgi:hypothetical protein
MKANIKNNANSFTNTTYPTAIFLIEGNTLYAALESNEIIVPLMPVSKSSNGKCNFVCVLREQEFVDAVLNDMFYDRENPTKKFSISLRSKETIVISDGQMVVAVASSISALNFAVHNIYDNIDQFKKTNLTGYYKGLKLNDEV